MIDAEHGTRGVSTNVDTPTGVLPTATCPRHEVHVADCKMCQRFYRIQLAQERGELLDGDPRKVESEGAHPNPSDMPSRRRTRHRTFRGQPVEVGSQTRPGIGNETRPGFESPSSDGIYPPDAEGVRPDAPNQDQTRPGRVSDAPSEPAYFDVGALFDGTLPETPIPDVCARTDGVGLFYRNQYNVVFGDPESGKTLLLDHTTVAELAVGGRVLRLDLDHNGPESTLGRLLEMGAPADVLRDRKRFLYIEPEDRLELLQVCEHMKTWSPSLVILDSIGELLPMFGSSSNSADEFTSCHTRVIKPLVRTTACVIGVDHMSKGAESRAYGAGGTMAKKRTLGGTSIRVKVDSVFTPGKGGSAWLTINKDRHGGLRASSPVASGKDEQLAGKFVLCPNIDPQRGGLLASVKAPTDGERPPNDAVPAEDLAAVAALVPPATSGNDAQKRLKWNAVRARNAYKAWLESKEDDRKGSTP